MTTIIQERLQKYSPQTHEEEVQALKEILQEIILCGLSNANFFKDAVFHGGTSLRIVYNLARFSEDMDFILKEANPDFKWQPFLNAIEEICKFYDIIPEVVDKSKAGKSVQQMFLKDNSIIKFLNLTVGVHSQQKLMIKLEIDTNPPAGSNSEIKFLDFPSAFAVEVQDLYSNFAGKSHALLCKSYIKGRDWYDFLWYVAKEVPLNFVFLSEAINQQGPWAQQNIQITPDWYFIELQKKIQTVDWKKAANDISPFLNEQDRATLKLWGVPFFMDRLQKLKRTLDNFSP